ncbi:MAG: hypothetical protein E7293_06465 [Lachnospiraceae bacterium]|nr:hypothetical protein [Lachnospiraceae bacterium]
MKTGRYETSRKRRSNRSKSLALVLSLVLVIGCVAGGTLAWLNAKTDEVKNTFSTSDIGVTLEETTNTYKMIPGWTIAKDPKATVTSNSEDCYLFIKVDKSNNFDTYMDMAIDSQWTALNETNNPGVYYIKIDEDSEKNVAYNILGEGKATYENENVEYTWADNQVLVKPTVTEKMMDEANPQPTLTFTAYAVQLMKNNTTEFTEAEAWGLAQTLETAN